MVIFTTHLHLATLESATTHLTKQLGKEITKVTALLAAVTGKFKTRIPIRWRFEVLAALIATTQLIVSSTFFGVRQHRIGFVEFLHLDFRVLLLGDIGMILARKFTERLLDVLGARIPVNSED